MKQRKQPHIISIIALFLLAATPSQADTPVEKIIASIAGHFEESYVDAEIGRRVGQELKRRASTYEGKEGKELAELLTRDMREITKDQHVQVHYSVKPIPPLDEAGPKPAPDAAARERQRANMARVNYGFFKVERMRANIGLLDLDFFADPDLGGDLAASAMTLLSNTDALIVDLRFNGGGNSRMVALLASYLFDGDPVHLNDLVIPRENLLKQSWTLPYVPGKRFGGTKPVYILTSTKTFSAAEEFAYNLQSQKRAVIVGERTRGGAHPGGRYRIAEHFAVAVPTTRAVNPITKSNWEGVGVAPDIPVAADDALRIAQIKILEEWIRNGPEELKEERQERKNALEKTN